MIASTAIHIRERLSPKEFSPYSDHAFHAALAQHFGARLHLRHVAYKRGDPAPSRHHVVLV